MLDEFLFVGEARPSCVEDSLQLKSWGMGSCQSDYFYRH